MKQQSLFVNALKESSSKDKAFSRLVSEYKERLYWHIRKIVLDHDDANDVVVDTPPVLGDELIMSLVASNRIFIPTQAQDYSIDGLEELLDTFEIIKDSENPDLEFSIILEAKLFTKYRINYFIHMI